MDLLVLLIFNTQEAHENPMQIEVSALLFHSSVFVNFFLHFRMQLLKVILIIGYKMEWSQVLWVHPHSIFFFLEFVILCVNLFLRNSSECSKKGLSRFQNGPLQVLPSFLQCTGKWRATLPCILKTLFRLFKGVF